MATNDYRAAGSKLMNPGRVNTILKAPDSNRPAMMIYVVEYKGINASVNNNGTFVPVDEKVTFLSNLKAETPISDTDNSPYPGQTDGKGFVIFKIGLSKGKEQESVTDINVPADH
jgi:2',3'-cyclic-nucleotide 2'-phosphodiesterase/3'-nucleotidase